MIVEDTFLSSWLTGACFQNLEAQAICLFLSIVYFVIQTSTSSCDVFFSGCSDSSCLHIVEPSLDVAVHAQCSLVDDLPCEMDLLHPPTPTHTQTLRNEYDCACLAFGLGHLEPGLPFQLTLQSTP